MHGSNQGKSEILITSIGCHFDLPVIPTGGRNLSVSERQGTLELAGFKAPGEGKCFKTKGLAGGTKEENRGLTQSLTGMARKRRRFSPYFPVQPSPWREGKSNGLVLLTRPSNISLYFFLSRSKSSFFMISSWFFRIIRRYTRDASVVWTFVPPWVLLRAL